uniref:DNA-binding protein RFX8 n=1 Tax=Callithrix jacchus TaxID=9483 RepID=UPI00159E6121|nr:DNA-binding protein RFX8 [Callithrix jacchus]
MAEVVSASPSSGGGSRGPHSCIIQWLVDNFCIREGYSTPRCLMYEIYMESCGQNAENQVNLATFGKRQLPSCPV